MLLTALVSVILTAMSAPPNPGIAPPPFTIAILADQSAQLPETGYNGNMCLEWEWASTTALFRLVSNSFKLRRTGLLLFLHLSLRVVSGSTVSILALLFTASLHFVSPLYIGDNSCMNWSSLILNCSPARQHFVYEYCNPLYGAGNGRLDLP